MPANAPDNAGRPAASAARSRLRRAGALCCLALAAALAVAECSWLIVCSDSPPSILPPAGENLPGELPLRFGIVGDNRGNMEVFETILARMQADGVRLIVHTGDIVHHHGIREFQWVLHEMDEAGIPAPICFVAGNHDVDESSPDPHARHRLYEEAFGQRRYWFSCADVLFIAFDTSSEGCDPEELDWLDKTLTEHRDEHRACFVYTHVPPRYPPAEVIGHSLGDDSEPLMQVLKKHRVSALLTSHIHSYLYYVVDDVPVYVSGGGGAELDRGDTTFHYLLCDVATDGSFQMQKVDVEAVSDTDSLEYRFRVEFPGASLPLFILALALAGWRLARRDRAGAPPAKP